MSSKPGQFHFDLMRSDGQAYRPLRIHLISPARTQEAYPGLRDRPDAWRGVVFDWTAG